MSPLQCQQVSYHRQIRMTFNKIFEYTAAARGFHYFKTFWQPKENAYLRCHFENGNCYDIFAIKTYDEKVRMVDHYCVKSLALQNLSLIVELK